MLINPDRIETVEETPDCVITMADGKKILVRESAQEVAGFGGRRRNDPPAAHDPGVYLNPNRANLRLATREEPEGGPVR
jgi:flagellar protein FlbD